MIPGPQDNRASTPISPEGRARRDEILSLMIRESGRLRRRRQVLRTGATTAALAAIGSLGLAVLYRAPAPLPRRVAHQSLPDSRPERPARPELPARVSVIRFAEGPSKPIGELAVPEGRSVVQWVDDDRLLDVLRTSGRPSALVYTGGRARVVAEEGRGTAIPPIP